ncbi:hypothetical protein ACWCRD_00735 [Streptomyces sp. NPDC002092]
MITLVNNLLTAGFVMYVVPILLIFRVAQRGFVAAMSTTGLKQPPCRPFARSHA